MGGWGEDGNLLLKSKVKVAQRLLNVAVRIVFHLVFFNAFKCEVCQEKRRLNLLLTYMAGAVGGCSDSSS